MTIGDLRQKQSLPLSAKILMSKQRIKEWYDYWDGNVYISNSGGVDSTVLSHLVHSLYPEVPDVYCDTGLEYPELRKFILSKPGVIVLKPSMYNRKTRKYEPITFSQVIEKYGYPLISKEQSSYIYEYRKTQSEKLKYIRKNGNKYGMGKISNKWIKFADENCPVLVGDKCCDVMKKNPAKRFEHESGLHPYIGTMTEESVQRQSNWLKYGCNAYSKERATSQPLSFWTKSDVLEYIHTFNVEYCSVYGDIICNDGIYTTTGCKRTGCVFCGFGQHLRCPNKFQQLSGDGVEIHKKLYDFCIRGGKFNDEGMWVPYNGLGMAKVLDMYGIKWWNDGDEEVRDKYREQYKKIEEDYKNKK